MRAKEENMLRCGKRIKDLEIDKSQYTFFLSVILILFNVFLFLAAIILIAKLRFWWVALIDISICLFVVASSVRTLKNAEKRLKYVLYENVLYIDSFSIEQQVDLTKVIAVRTKRSVFDRILKQSSHTIEIFMNTKYNKKIILYFMNANLDETVKDIIKQCEIAKDIKSMVFEKKTKKKKSLA